MIGATLGTYSEMHTPSYPSWIRRRRSGIILVPPRARVAVGCSLADDGEERRGSSADAAPAALLLAACTDAFDTSAGAVRPESVIDRIRRDDLDLSRLKRLVACIPDSEELQFSADLGFIVSKADRPPQVLIVSPREIDQSVLAPLPVRRWRTAELRHRATEYEGRFFMHTKKHRYVENPDVLRRKVKEVIRLIHQDADPHELNAYKRFVKKHVSIFSRAYFTAYLVKMLAEGRSLEAPK
ncbi:MAG: hypothetical protein MI724_20645, partial [Spirochaetales bacterium]|nr:hypothetical protein [Spirochaetales bacterium]